MLKIVKSSFTAAGRVSLHEKIRALTEKGVRSYLIVPEQQTVMTESEMSRVLPGSAPLTFEVTNFTRFANSTFRTLGGISGEYCDKGKKALLMWRTLTELSPTLNMTRGRREINEGLVEKALAAVGEMQSLAISADELASVTDSESVKADARLSAKLTDLSRILALYKSLLTERYSDTGDDAEMMVKKLAEHPDFLSDTEIFIEGFTSFTEPQYKLLSVLMKRTTVTVLLEISKAREDAFEFAEIRWTIDRLKAAARRSGADIKLLHEDGRRNTKSEALSLISDSLWQTNPTFDNISLQNPDELRIFEAKTPFDECDFIASDIKRRVMGGAKYSDFAIVARDAKRYSGILDTALTKAGIPHFTGLCRDVETFEAIKLIYTAYAIVRGGFVREDVLTYAKCGFSGISREECDELEMYVNKWQISGARFTDGEPWSMNPRGYTTHRPDGTDEKLVRLHDIRGRLIDPLVRFSANVKRARTVKEHAEVLLDFLTSINLDRALAERADALERLSEHTSAEGNRRLWQLICDSLDTLVDLGGTLPSDGESFLGQLRVLFSTANLAAIPAFLDEVTIGSADMLRLGGVAHVYLIGVNAGEFPATPSDVSYFSDRDKAALSECGLAIEPDLEIKGARELYSFTRAFTYARDSVTLLYTACDTKFKSIERASLIDKIEALTGGAVRAVKLSSLKASDTLWYAEGALEALGSIDESDYPSVKAALEKSGHAKALRIAEGSITNENMALSDSITDENESRPITLSQTRIDSFVSCPLGYFCRFTVGLSEEKRAEFDAPGIGSFIHAILENFFKALDREDRSAGTLTADERRDLTRSAAEKYIKELACEGSSNAARTKIKLDRLCRAAMPVVDGLCEEFAESSFRPKFFELAIKRTHDPSSPSPVAITPDSGGDIYVMGIVDRVDTYKRDDDVFIRVVDYKTGHKEFSPEDMAEGRNLQMFLYLKALLDTRNEEFKKKLGVTGDGKILPSGVIYVKTSVADARVDTPDDAAALAAVKGAQKREGMVLDDPDVISAMGLKYTPLYSARTPNKISDTKKKFLFTEDSLEDIMETVEESVAAIAGGIRSGNASASPKADKHGLTHCDYCEYKPICRAAKIK